MCWFVLFLSSTGSAYKRIGADAHEEVPLLISNIVWRKIQKRDFFLFWGVLATFEMIVSLTAFLAFLWVIWISFCCGQAEWVILGISLAPAAKTSHSFAWPCPPCPEFLLPDNCWQLTDKLPTNPPYVRYSLIAAQFLYKFNAPESSDWFLSKPYQRYSRWFLTITRNPGSCSKGLVVFCWFKKGHQIFWWLPDATFYPRPFSPLLI